MIAQPPLVTLIYAGVNGLFALFLAVRVTLSRAQKKIDLGDSGDTEMRQRVRAHANNAEYIPLVLVLMAIDEAAGGQPMALHLIGIVLTLGRLVHAYGLSTSPGVSPGRVIGQSATWLSLAAAALYAIYLYFVRGSA